MSLVGGGGLSEGGSSPSNQNMLLKCNILSHFWPFETMFFSGGYIYISYIYMKLTIFHIGWGEGVRAVKFHNIIENNTLYFNTKNNFLRP